MFLVPQAGRFTPASYQALPFAPDRSRSRTGRTIPFQPQERSAMSPHRDPQTIPVARDLPAARVCRACKKPFRAGAGMPGGDLCPSCYYTIYDDEE